MSNDPFEMVPGKMVLKAMQCPVANCIAPRCQGHLLCLRHWREVPTTVKAGILKAWRAYEDERTPDALNEWKDRAGLVIGLLSGACV